MERHFAVLTGDLVRSRRLSRQGLEKARSTLLTAVNELSRWKTGVVRGKVEFFRGDAWQLVLGEAALGLRAAFFLRASLLAQGGPDTRVSVGIGKVDQVSRRRVSLSSGQAFTLSGHALDELTQYSRIAIVFPEESGKNTEWLPVVAELCDTLMRRWTQRQAEIVRIALVPNDLTHARIAERLESPVSKQAVTKTLAGAGWHSLETALKTFETIHKRRGGKAP